MNSKQFLTGISLFFIFSTPLPSFAAKKKDFQIWNYDSVTSQINTRVDFFGEVEFRWRDNASTLYYNHEHIEFKVHVLPYLQIGPCYRQIWAKNDLNKWIGESEPNINIMLLGDVHGFMFYDRSRIAYRIFYDNAPDVWQFRHKLVISKLLWRKPTEISLFVDDEIFLEQKQRGIYENRTSIGLNIELIKQLFAEIGYRYRIIRSGNFWEHDNILLLNLRATF